MLRFLKKYSEPIIISLISFIVISVNIFPFLYRLINTPPDRGFAGYQFYTLDYNIYLGHFKEGAKGVWLVHDKHTSEPQNGFLLRREYIIWGFLTGYLLHFPIVFVYHSARIFGAFLLLLSIYLLIKEAFPDDPTRSESGAVPQKWKRIIAFFLATLIAGFPKIGIDPTTGKQTLDLYFFWFTENDTAEKFGELFHYQLGNSILLFSIIVYSRFLKSKITIASTTTIIYKRLWLRSLTFLSRLPSSLLSLITYLLNFLIHNSKFIILNLFLLYAAALIHPSTYITINLLFCIYLSINISISILKYILVHKTTSGILTKEIVYLGVMVLLSLPVIPLLQQEVSRFPWNEIAKWDRAAYSPIDIKEYILSLGPNFFLAALGGLIIVGRASREQFLSFFSTLRQLAHRSKNNTRNPSSTLQSQDPASSIQLPAPKNIPITNNQILLLILSFPLATFLLTFKLWPYLLDINRLSFVQVPIYAPLAILAVIGITFLASFISRCFAFCFALFRVIPMAKLQPLVNAITLLIICSLLYITFPAYKFGLMREITMFPKGDGLLYPDKPFMAALDWLDKNTSPGEVVLSGWQASGLIPGFSGNFSFSGHPWSTVNFAQKEALKDQFFRTQMTPEEARAFLKTYRIDYIFYSPQEKSYGGNLKQYGEFLTPVYQTPDVTIYMVNR